ncbi:hypothetical protein JHK82_027226 [Glycine max]|uniref:GIR1-like zinc ribbon domain-containing protein n=1 Tax=Glycine soja TaxID=3848 RepID=A0A445IJH3_GLYSO|nr:hypothetical protein JHK85_027860 [Glycine max]KAG5126391.1 hypothetical protein JHK82_027226 [Glycine max]RZB86196.1 hypothetical protein D0Y65_026311 [Glycine soja]
MSKSSLGLAHSNSDYCQSLLRSVSWRREKNLPKYGMVANQILDSPPQLPIAPPTSPSSSCVSSELSQDDNNNNNKNNDNNNNGCTRSPEDISMVQEGCSRCLMYMMVNEGEPKCPKCKSTTLIHFLNYNNIP